MKSKLTPIWPALFVALAAGMANAQRDFQLTVTTNGQAGFAISWPAQSATPPSSLMVMPQYQLWRSADLVKWIPVGPPFSPASRQMIACADTNSVCAFYRVQSIIDLEYASLDNAELASADFRGADCLGAEFFGTDFSQAELQGANFAAADIRNANFSGADLTGASLFFANAAVAIFDEGTFEGVNAAFANLSDASFLGVILAHTDFSHAILSGVDFDFADLSGVVVDGDTVMDPKAALVWQIVNEGDTNADLNGQDLSFTVLANGNLRGTSLVGANLTEADLFDADLRGANLHAAIMPLVNLIGAILDSATMLDPQPKLVWQLVNEGGVNRNLQNANLSETFLALADFSGANLSRANLSDSECFECLFGGANLTSCSFSGSDLTSAVLTNANLTSANLSSADLTGATLRNAITNGAVFTGATFNNTVMPDGSVRNQ